MRRKIFASVSMVLLLAGAFVARAAEPEQESRVLIKDHKFSPSEVRVKANMKIKLVLTNEDMTVEEFESFSLDREKVVRPGESVTMFLPPLNPGSYEFEGEYHSETAKGRIVAE